jgi:hypothetical protein
MEHETDLHFDMFGDCNGVMGCASYSDRLIIQIQFVCAYGWLTWLSKVPMRLVSTASKSRTAPDSLLIPCSPIIAIERVFALITSAESDSRKVMADMIWSVAGDSSLWLLRPYSARPASQAKRGPLLVRMEEDSLSRRGRSSVHESGDMFCKP